MKSRTAREKSCAVCFLLQARKKAQANKRMENPLKKMSYETSYATL
jgi:hypothetical protein